MSSMFCPLVRVSFITLLGALPSLALAKDSNEPEVPFSEACSYTCTSGGWELIVYEADDIQAWKMVMMPTQATFYSSVIIGSQWEYVTTQTDVSAGGYCDMGGYYIYGDVYLVSQIGQWNSHSTNQLNGYSPCTEAGGYTSIEDWLDTLAAYTTSPQWDVPQYCTDIDCLIPEGVDHEEVDHEPFTYTDASNEVKDFDFLDGDDGQQGGSGGGAAARPSVRTDKR